MARRTLFPRMWMAVARGRVLRGDRPPSTRKWLLAAGLLPTEPETQATVSHHDAPARTEPPHHAPHPERQLRAEPSHGTPTYGQPQPDSPSVRQPASPP